MSRSECLLVSVNLVVDTAATSARVCRLVIRPTMLKTRPSLFIVTRTHKRAYKQTRSETIPTSEPGTILGFAMNVEGNRRKDQEETAVRVILIPVKLQSKCCTGLGVAGSYQLMTCLSVYEFFRNFCC